jgi:type I restriction enzyme R subunit
MHALEALALLCEPVEPPKGELEHIHYFCGNTEIPADLQEREPQRVALYKATVALVRAYANIADELEAAGYGPAETSPRIKQPGALPEAARDHPQGQRRDLDLKPTRPTCAT